MKHYITILAFFISCFCYAQSELNTLLSSYAANIKTDNAPFGNSCIYYTNYINVSQNGSIITMSYGFGGGRTADGDLIQRITIRFDLRTATICNGYWYKSFGSWQHNGDKKIVSISDSNGIEMIRVGAQNYNYGETVNYLPEKIQFDFGSEPLANRVVTAFLALQNGYKEVDEWLLPPVNDNSSESDANPQPTQNKNRATHSKKHKSSPKNNTTPNKPKKSKSGKYGE